MSGDYTRDTQCIIGIFLLALNSSFLQEFGYTIIKYILQEPVVFTKCSITVNNLCIYYNSAVSILNCTCISKVYFTNLEFTSAF